MWVLVVGRALRAVAWLVRRRKKLKSSDKLFLRLRQGEKNLSDDRAELGKLAFPEHSPAPASAPYSVAKLEKSIPRRNSSVSILRLPASCKRSTFR